MKHHELGWVLFLFLYVLPGCSTDPGTGVPLAGGARTLFTYDRGDITVEIGVSGADITARALLLGTNSATGEIEPATELDMGVSVTWPDQITLFLPDCSTSAPLLNTETQMTSKTFRYHYPDSCGSTPSLEPTAEISVVVSKANLPDRIVNGGTPISGNSTVTISGLALSAAQSLPGSLIFQNIDFAKTEDSQSAYWHAVNYEYSYHLYLTGYFNDPQYSIPLDATIEGIKVNCQWREVKNTSGDCYASTVRLLKAGTPVGNNKGTMAPLPLSMSLSSDYGRNNDLWGATFTPNEINQIGFGVELQIEGGLDVEAYIDYCRVSVYWHQ